MLRILELGINTNQWTGFRNKLSLKVNEISTSGSSKIKKKLIFKLTPEVAKQNTHFRTVVDISFDIGPGMDSEAC